MSEQNRYHSSCAQSYGALTTKIDASNPQRGAALLEYALVVALVAVVGISGVRGLGAELDASFIKSAGLVAGAGGICQPDDPRCVYEDDPFGQ